MKRLILSILLMYSSLSFSAEPKLHDYKVTRVVDGDTVEFEVPGLPEELGTTLKLRVYGVDTPEKGFRAACESEAKRGEEATAFGKEAIKQAKKIQISLKEWDKFGGRVLGDLYLDGQSYRTMLIEKGLAREYFGDKKKSWCN